MSTIVSGVDGKGSKVNSRNQVRDFINLATGYPINTFPNWTWNLSTPRDNQINILALYKLRLNTLV